MLRNRWNDTDLHHGSILFLHFFEWINIIDYHPSKTRCGLHPRSPIIWMWFPASRDRDVMNKIFFDVKLWINCFVLYYNWIDFYQIWWTIFILFIQITNVQMGRYYVGADSLYIGVCLSCGDIQLFVLVKSAKKETKHVL